MKINIQIISSSNLNKLLCKKLIEENHNIVSISESYEDALYDYSSSQPDIVILDLDINNNHSGIALCRKIYNLDTYAKVIVLSDHLDVLKKSELYEIGVEFWLDKPFEVSKIFEYIDTIKENNNLLDSRNKRSHIVNSSIYDREDSTDDYFELDLDTSKEYTKSYNPDSHGTNNHLNNLSNGISEGTQIGDNQQRKKGYMSLPIFIDDTVTSTEESLEAANSERKQLKGFLNKFKK